MACYHPSGVDVARPLPGSDGSTRDDYIRVPCGSCMGCRTDQARSWAVRMYHEMLTTDAQRAWFVTLTYDNDHLPYAGDLSHDDVTNFLQRLRRTSSVPVRYYLCGEYGERTHRPHYHMVLFGPPLYDRVPARYDDLAPVYSSKLLSDAWGFGRVEASPLTMGSALYVAGYVTKKVRKQDDPDHYLRYAETGELVELQPEFARMSRNPGIGYAYLKKYYRDIYPRDRVRINGVDFFPPRYYDTKLEALDPDLHAEVMTNRLRNPDQEEPTDWHDLDYRRNPNRERIHAARTRLFTSRDAI